MLEVTSFHDQRNSFKNISILKDFKVAFMTCSSVKGSLLGPLAEGMVFLNAILCSVNRKDLEWVD